MADALATWNTSMETQFAAAAGGEVSMYPPGAGKWFVESITISPVVTSAANSTNYVSIDVESGADGGSNMSSAALTTASTALTAGTERTFSLNTGATRVIDDDSGEYVNFEVTQVASGVICHFVLKIAWSRMR